MSKPDDVSRHAPQRAGPCNSIELAHVDDGVTSPQTRPKLARRGPCLRIQAADDGGFSDVGEAEIAVGSGPQVLVFDRPTARKASHYATAVP